MNKWLSTVTRINRDRYQIPDGWLPREAVAEQLQCSPDKVADILKPGIASGDFESAEFPVWDEKRRMTLRVRCYRIVADASGKSPGPKPSPETRPVGQSLEDKIRATILKHPDWNIVRICKNHRGATAALVRSIQSRP